MTPVVITNTTQTPPLFSNAKAYPPTHEGDGSASQNDGVVSPKDTNPISVDTVNISPESRQAIAELEKEKAKKLEAAAADNADKPERPAARIQFFYNQKGDLAIRYMDASDKLIYQSPSEIMLRMKEEESKHDSSVDTKA